MSGLNRMPKRLLATTATILLLLLLISTAPSLGQVNGILRIDNNRLNGTADGGQLLLYTPDPVQLGSSMSHWDTSATPDLLMEPFLSPDLPFLGLDVTPGLMLDLGWQPGTSNITIFNLDPVGTGFTDPRPFSGDPGNQATTLGEARVNLFNAVLGAWANTLQSPVDIDVLVTWLPLNCIQGVGAALAGAVTTAIFADAPGGAFPFGNTWYHAPLAEALIGLDLNGPPAEGGGDLIVLMNDDIDNECLGPATGWYYGLDGTPPPGRIDQASTVLHELAHGLGFANFTNEANGGLIQGLPGIYDLFSLDTTTGLTWDQMTDAERVASAINFRRVVWNGQNANAQAQTVLTPGVPELLVTSPPEVAGSYAVGVATFGPPIPPGGLGGRIVCLKDDVLDETLLNGCTPAQNAAQLAGKIALIDRGGCAFSTKVANAQAAGAIGAVIVNNAGNTAFDPGGSDDTITIPAALVGRRDGNNIRQAACPEAASFLGNDERFQFTAQWSDGVRQSEAKGNMFTDNSGYFYFFSADNVEVTVKVLDACADPSFNNFWVFAAGMTDVEVTLTIVDTQSGQSKQYFNPLGQPFQPILDTEGFATCP